VLGGGGRRRGLGRGGLGGGTAKISGGCVSHARHYRAGRRLEHVEQAAGSRTPFRAEHTAVPRRLDENFWHRGVHPDPPLVYSRPVPSSRGRYFNATLLFAFASAPRSAGPQTRSPLPLWRRRSPPAPSLGRDAPCRPLISNAP